MSGRLIALDLPPGMRFVDRLRSAWEDGDAVLPIDQRLPRSAMAALVRQQRPHLIVAEHEDVTPELDPVPIGADDAVVVPTSGSTGHPKGVVLTHHSIRASIDASTSRLGSEPDDHWLACLPFAHVGGLSVVFRALLNETRLTVLPRFDVAAVTEAAAAGANLVSLVPTLLARIDPMLFRAVLVGGSRPPLHRPSHVVATYGMTETGSGVVYDRRPLDRVELRIVDGEIEVRGPMLFRCYRGGGDPGVPTSTTGRPFEWSPIGDDGWFATGDLGEVLPDGSLHVFGRRADLIISGGENIWPTPVEEAIQQLPQVADVIVAGTDDAEWGEIVTAHVVPTPGATVTLADLRTQVKATLPGFCAPRQIVVHKALPRTPLGKPQRHLVRDLRQEPRSPER